MRRVLLLSSICLLAAGCAINRKPLRQSTTAFEQLDPAVQARVAEGQVEVGYTAQMVERALGEPKRINAKASGTSVVATWIYPDHEGGPLHVTLRHGQVTEIERPRAPQK